MAATTLAGFSLTGVRAVAFQNTALSPALEGRDLRISGMVMAMPQVSPDGLRFRFRVDTALLGERPVQLPGQIDLGWYAGFAAREPAVTAAPAHDATGAPDAV
ncbi:MAG: competence protein ComEC, partial [Comamonadaceae bacterium]